MKCSTLVFGAALALLAGGVSAQQPAGNAAAADVWKYKTQRLTRAQIDRLLADPAKVLVLDVRRPDEVVSKGSFPVYLSVQAKDLESELAFVPRDRQIITLSNHAHRAGAAGDLLASKGFVVAGAAGSEDYEAQGGKIARITPPPPAPTASR
jgi:rhodanese-related sulfurtransferase